MLPGLLYHLIRRDTGRLANEVFTSNPIVSSKQWLGSLKLQTEMLINMAAERNVNVNNLVKVIVQHPAFQETINSILTATNQE